MTTEAYPGGARPGISTGGLIIVDDVHVHTYVGGRES